MDSSPTKVKVFARAEGLDVIFGLKVTFWVSVALGRLFLCAEFFL